MYVWNCQFYLKMSHVRVKLKFCEDVTFMCGTVCSVKMSRVHVELSVLFEDVTCTCETVCSVKMSWYVWNCKFCLKMLRVRVEL